MRRIPWRAQREGALFAFREKRQRPAKIICRRQMHRALHTTSRPTPVESSFAYFWSVCQKYGGVRGRDTAVLFLIWISQDNSNNHQNRRFAHRQAPSFLMGVKKEAKNAPLAWCNVK